MLLETESGIMARADAHVVRLLMDGSRTERRMMAADRTVARAYQRVLMLRRFRAICDASEHAKIERELVREMAPTWGRSMRVKVGRAAGGDGAGTGSASSGRKAPQGILKATSSRRAIRVYQCPLLDARGRVAIFFRVRYAGLKSKNWRLGLSADHALYILREEALEDGEIVARLGPISSMGETPEEIADCWRALEIAEEGYRANATVQHRIIWALPHGLDAAQRHELVTDYCERTFGRLGLAYVAANHRADSKGDQRNFHAHICFSGRPCERTGEGHFEIALEKVNGLTDPAGLKRLRALACAHANDACRDAGLEVLFSHLTYKERGIDAVRQRHVGAAAMAAHDRGEKVASVEHNERVVERNEVAFARDAATRELTLRTGLTAAARMAADNEVAQERVAAIRARSTTIAEQARAMAAVMRPAVWAMQTGIADMAVRARTMAAGRRPSAPVSRLRVDNLARRVRAMATVVAGHPSRDPASISIDRPKNLAAAASRLARECQSADEPRAQSVSAYSRLAAIRTAIAAHTADNQRRDAEAVIRDGAVTPYVVRDGRLILQTNGMTAADAGLVMTLDGTAVAVALRERYRRDRERDAADAVVRESATLRQRDEEAQRRRNVDEVCRLILEATDRPYGRDGKNISLDLSRMDEASQALIGTTGTADKAVVDALRQRFERDEQVDALDALVKAIEAERMFVAEAEGRYSIDKTIMARFRVAPEAVADAGTQDRLHAVNQRQRAEIIPLLMHAMGNAEQIVPTDKGWTLSTAAPEELRRLAQEWRHDAGVQRGFEQMATAHRQRRGVPMGDLPVDRSTPAGVPIAVAASRAEVAAVSWRAARHIREQAMAASDDAERRDDSGLPQPGRRIERPGAVRKARPISLAARMAGLAGSGHGD